MKRLITIEVLLDDVKEDVVMRIAHSIEEHTRRTVARYSGATVIDVQELEEDR